MIMIMIMMMMMMMMIIMIMIPCMYRNKGFGYERSPFVMVHGS